MVAITTTPTSTHSTARIMEADMTVGQIHGVILTMRQGGLVHSVIIGEALTIMVGV